MKYSHYTRSGPNVFENGLGACTGQTRPDMKVGICGEHGGNPDSIRFCHDIGLGYVSCSVPRVPVARLAAAHAAQASTPWTDGKVRGMPAPCWKRGGIKPHP